MPNPKNKHKLRLLKLLIVAVLLIGFLAFTNPRELTAHFLIVPFVFLFAIFYLVSITLVELAFSAYSRKKQLFLAIVLASAPTGLLLLQSISQLSIRDVVLTLMFLSLFGFYVLRQDLI
jgi:hypothetical protein